jgi:hypothetical protein
MRHYSAGRRVEMQAAEGAAMPYPDQYRDSEVSEPAIHT